MHKTIEETSTLSSLMLHIEGGGKGRKESKVPIFLSEKGQTIGGTERVHIFVVWVSSYANESIAMQGRREYWLTEGSHPIFPATLGPGIRGSLWDLCQLWETPQLISPWHVPSGREWGNFLVKPALLLCPSFLCPPTPLLSSCIRYSGPPWYRHFCSQGTPSVRRETNVTEYNWRAERLMRGSLGRFWRGRDVSAGSSKINRVSLDSEARGRPCWEGEQREEKHKSAKVHSISQKQHVVCLGWTVDTWRPQGGLNTCSTAKCRVRADARGWHSIKYKYPSDNETLYGLCNAFHVSRLIITALKALEKC